MSDLVEELLRKARALAPEERVRLAEEPLATVMKARAPEPERWAPHF